MGYYLRFIITENKSINLLFLTQIDKAYRLVTDQVDSTDLFWNDQLLGTVEINTPDDDIFEEDIEDLKDLVKHSNSDKKQHIITPLDKSKSILAISALWQGDDPEPTLSKLDPIWDWLFAHYDGILQADNDGFYDKDGLILDMNLKI